MKNQCNTISKDKKNYEEIIIEGPFLSANLLLSLARIGLAAAANTASASARRMIERLTERITMKCWCVASSA